MGENTSKASNVLPLRGILYDPFKAGDLSKVMAPPYDVISQEYQDVLYTRHPNNIVRLILGKTGENDAPGNNRYTRAKDGFYAWLKDGVLVRDTMPAIYYYTQTYRYLEREVVRKGFIALARLRDLGEGNVHPHEKTLAGPKADRLNLMLSCKANLCCIFSLYSEPLGGREGIVWMLEKNTATAPLIDVQDDDGVINRVWRIVSKPVIDAVVLRMEDKPLFIADGHHRYETALNYRNLMRRETGRTSGREPFDYVMMYFSNMDDEGMTIMPTHRVIHSLKGFDPDSFLKAIADYFDVEGFGFNAEGWREARKRFTERLAAKEREAVTAFGLYMRGRDSYLVLTLKDMSVMDTFFDALTPWVYKSLDVTVLHSLILGRVLNITQGSQERQENIVYVKGLDKAFSEVGKEPNQILFVMNPTRIEQVRAVAEAGLVMPQKSTYFYPKLLSGLVINYLGEDGSAPGL
ncbi:MAG: DUF1015 domain-containing protein [Deltaproteobacteria bacterium]|nr:DUF1015 domain-containing protein [Deltaproteobacteria bacterium]